MFFSNRLVSRLRANFLGRTGAIYFGFILFLFVSLFFFVDVSKFINNFYYVFYAVPVFFLAVPAFFGVRLWRVERLLLVYFFSCLVSGFLGGGVVYVFKHQVYLILLFFGLSVCCVDYGYFCRLALVYFLVCMALALFAGYLWFDSLFLFGEFRRVELFGAAKNPVHASLMIMTGWMGFWVIFGLPKLMGERWFYYAAGFFAMLLGGFAICVFFQSRSAFLGFVFSVLAWFALGGRRALGAGVLVLLSTLLLAFGGLEPLLDRGLSYRAAIWKEAIGRLYGSCSWLFGCAQDGGFLYLGQFQHAHSAYVSIFVNSGVIGGVAFLVFSSCYFFEGWKARSKWFVVSLVGWGGVFASSNGLVDTPRPLWVYFWIPTMLAILECKGVMSGESGLYSSVVRKAGATPI